MSTTQPLRLDVLIRTSQRKTEGKSPAQQLEICKTSASINGHQLMAVHDSGGDESGKTMARPTIEAIRRRIAAGEIDGFTLAFIDRFGRAPIEESMGVVRDFHRIGGVMVPADQGGHPINLDDPQAETNLVIQMQIARQYWLATQRRFAMSQADAIKAGITPYPRVPPGLHRRKDGKVEHHLTEGPVIVEMFAMRLRGATVGQLRAHLAEHGIERTLVGTHKLLTKRIYVGELRFGKHVNFKAVEPLIDPEVFKAVGKMIVPRGRPAKSDRLLARLGVVRCGVCRRPMCAATQLATARQREYHFYRCNQHSSDCAGRPSIKAETLEAEVDQWMRDKIVGQKGRASLVEEIETALVEKDRAEDTLASAVELAMRFPTRRNDDVLDVLEAERDLTLATYTELVNLGAALTFDPTRRWEDVLDPEKRDLIRAMIARVEVAPGRGPGRVTITGKQKATRDAVKDPLDLSLNVGR